MAIMSVYSDAEAMMMSPEGSTSPSSSNEGKGRVFYCNLCCYRTDRKNNLKRHTHTMHELSPALLECCGVRFLNKAELRMHSYKYHRDGYHCKDCSRVFCRKALLKRHSSVHSGYKEFSCQLCAYRTSHKSNLERHMRVHQKNGGGPLPRHLLGGGFLPELSQTNSHFSSATELQHAFLPTRHIPLFSDYHRGANFYPMPCNHASWSIISGMPQPNPPATFQQHHQPTPLHLPSQDNPRLAMASPKKKGPSCSFSISALLGEEPQEHDAEKSKAKSSVTSTSLHLPPPQGLTWTSMATGREYEPPLPPDATQSGSANSSVAWKHAHMSSGVLKPTPVQAHSPNFVLDLTRASTSAEVSYIDRVQESIYTMYSQPATDDDLAFPGRHSPPPPPHIMSSHTPTPILDPNPTHGSTTPLTLDHQPTHGSSTTPPYAHTPPREHQDSSGSSGYGSPEVSESPRIPGQSHGAEDDLECAQEPSLLEMEVDQEYVPKKLRLSKRFKSIQKRLW